MIREIFGYWVWIGLLVLIIMGTYIWVKYGKKHFLWKILALIMYAYAIAVIVMQYIDAKKELA